MRIGPRGQAFDAPTIDGDVMEVKGNLHALFPGKLLVESRYTEALRAQLDGYLDRIVDRDFEEQGYTVRRPQVLRRWMTAFAAATATTTSLEKIRNAATSGTEEVPAKTTVIAYRNVLEQLWILDQWLREQLGTILTDMAVITTGRHAYRRQGGVAVIPAALLGP